MTAIPPSLEVIEQEAKVLADLHAVVRLNRLPADYEMLNASIAYLAEDTERALRIAMLWAHKIVTPIRPNFDLSNPDAGIYLTNDDDSPAEDGETAAGLFVNFVLRENYTCAQEVYDELVEDFTETDLQRFLALMLAMAAN